MTLYSGIPTRYPNGVISNPSGNSSVGSAIWAVNGNCTTSATTGPYVGWDSIPLGSELFDSTHATQGFLINGNTGVQTEEEEYFMSSSDDGTVHSIGAGYIYSTAGSTFTGAVLNTGKWNSSNNSFTWTQTNFQPPLLSGPTNLSYPRSSHSFDTLAQMLGVPGTAWSQDGTTGYVVIFGNLDSTDANTGQNLNFVSFQPIIWKTINSGSTWTMLPPHDFKNDPVFSEYLNPCVDSPNVVIPRWFLYSDFIDAVGSYDLVVDANYNLHIIGDVQANSEDKPDSSDYLNYYYQQYIFDVSTTTSNGYNVRYIDSLYTQPWTNAIISGSWNSQSTSSVGSVGFGPRIQTTRTTDGSKIFCTWLDDISGSGVDSLEYPDIFGQGFDVTNNNFTPIQSFTYNTPIAEANYFICISDIAIQNSPFYYIPGTELIPPNNYNGASGCEYGYLDSVIVYNDGMFTDAVKTINAPSGIAVSPNYPNPYNKTTQFIVTLDKESTIGVDVYNMVGEAIWSTVTGKMGTGGHIITIDGSTFSSGVYFYRVTAEGSSVTRKMVIAK
jgi:hypothetical protein